MYMQFKLNVIKIKLILILIFNFIKIKLINKLIKKLNACIKAMLLFGPSRN